MTPRDMLKELVRQGNRFRQTPVVDDDFPALRDGFDLTLSAADQYLRRSFPIVVCLCGSTRFQEAFEQANERETLAGRIVLSVGMFGHAKRIDMDGPIKKALDELHFRKIELADEVLILNVGGYIGESTRRELEHARRLGKTVRFLEPEGTSDAHPVAEGGGENHHR